jgi:hypothetical protein
MDTEYLQKTYENNFKIIEEKGIKEGQVWVGLEFPYRECKITSIHPLYGWVVSTPYFINQDLSNINKFKEIVNN